MWHDGDAQDWNHRLDCGDVEAVLGGGECDHVLEGEARVGGQEHFYLEPNAAIVIPKEMDEIESYASTQVQNLSDRDCCLHSFLELSACRTFINCEELRCIPCGLAS